MKIRKAVITAAGRNQRGLPLQTLIDQDGEEKTVLRILVEQVLHAAVEEICVVTWPGDETRYAQALGSQAGCVRFIAQPEPRGYGHAVYCAREFAGDAAFLHLVGDHLHVSSNHHPAAQTLVQLAEAEACAISAVQPTREHLLPHYGIVGGRRMPGRDKLYRVETVIEKPTPTEAEQRLTVPGMRAGYYLGFFGMHVLTPGVMEILARLLAAAQGRPVTLSAALAELARREQYLALEASGRRFDIGARYGLFVAQLALALEGRDHDEVVKHLLELLATRELAAAGGAQ